MDNITWGELGKAWNKALIKLLMILPKRIIDGAQTNKPKTHKDTITRMIPALIMVLSAASITNLSTRAYSHHANASSYLVGAGLAVLVPVAVFVALKIDEKYKWWVWAIAFCFAVISAAIQIQVYMPAVIAWERWDQIAEAIAFGAGVPTAECLLAAMEAFLLAQGQRNEQADKQAQIDAEKQRLADEQAHQVAELERQRQQAEAERQAEFERRKQEIELQSYAAKLAQEAELQRLEAQAKIEAERLKLEAKLQQKNVAKSVANPNPESVARNANTPEKVKGKENPATQRRNALLRLLQQHGDIGDVAFGKELSVDRTTIYRDFKAMEKAGLVHPNGNGWTVN